MDASPENEIGSPQNRVSAAAASALVAVRDAPPSQTSKAATCTDSELPPKDGVTRLSTVPEAIMGARCPGFSQTRPAEERAGERPGVRVGVQSSPCVASQEKSNGEREQGGPMSPAAGGNVPPARRHAPGTPIRKGLQFPRNCPPASEPVPSGAPRPDCHASLRAASGTNRVPQTATEAGVKAGTEVYMAETDERGNSAENPNVRPPSPAGGAAQQAIPVPLMRSSASLKVPAAPVAVGGDTAGSTSSPTRQIPDMAVGPLASAKPEERLATVAVVTTGSVVSPVSAAVKEARNGTQNLTPSSASVPHEAPPESFRAKASLATPSQIPSPPPAASATLPASVLPATAETMSKPIPHAATSVDQPLKSSQPPVASKPALDVMPALGAPPSCAPAAAEGGLPSQPVEVSELERAKAEWRKEKLREKTRRDEKKRERKLLATASQSRVQKKPRAQPRASEVESSGVYHHHGDVHDHDHHHDHHDHLLLGHDGHHHHHDHVHSDANPAHEHIDHSHSHSHSHVYAHSHDHDHDHDYDHDHSHNHDHHDTDPHGYDHAHHTYHGDHAHTHPHADHSGREHSHADDVVHVDHHHHIHAEIDHDESGEHGHSVHDAVGPHEHHCEHHSIHQDPAPSHASHAHGDGSGDMAHGHAMHHTYPEPRPTEPSSGRARNSGDACIDTGSGGGAATLRPAVMSEIELQRNAESDWRERKLKEIADRIAKKNYRRGRRNATQGTQGVRMAPSTLTEALSEACAVADSHIQQGTAGEAPPPTTQAQDAASLGHGGDAATSAAGGVDGALSAANMAAVASLSVAAPVSHPRTGLHGPMLDDGSPSGPPTALTEHAPFAGRGSQREAGRTGESKPEVSSPAHTANSSSPPNSETVDPVEGCIVPVGSLDCQEETIVRTNPVPRTNPGPGLTGKGSPQTPVECPP